MLALMQMAHNYENDWEFWSTQPAPSYQPTTRPLEEPPVFDYEYFLSVNRDEIPSDARLKRLFEKDIGMRYRWSDEMTEDRLLKQHIDWIDDMKLAEFEGERQEFYTGLYEQLWVGCRGESWWR